MKPGRVVCGSVVEIATSRSGSDTGTGRRTIALSRLKIAVFAAMVSANSGNHDH